MNEPRYKAQPLSRADIRELAAEYRQKLNLTGVAYVDILSLMENVFPVLYAKAGFNYSYETREVMGNNHGLTDPRTGQIMIREYVYQNAYDGKGRDRMTIAHELAHFILHDGVTIGLARASMDENIPPYRDPEWQATCFAAEFLMGAEVIKNMTPEQIAERCGVSLEAARYQKSKIK